MSKANGTLAETLYAGPEAMKALLAEAILEIWEIFGEVPHLNLPRVRKTPRERPAKRLVERHLKNNKPLISKNGHQ